MPQQRAESPPESADPLEEVYRRLVSIHHALATDLDGGVELQTRTRHRVKDLLDYVGGKLDTRETTRPASGPRTLDAGPPKPNASRASRPEARAGRSARPSS
jgi:hypothetical protein